MKKKTISFLINIVYGTDEITLWDYRIGQKSKILSPSSVPSSSLFDQVEFASIEITMID